MKGVSPVRSHRLAATFLLAGSEMQRAKETDPFPMPSWLSSGSQVVALDITQSLSCHPGFVRATSELKQCRAILAGQMLAARRELQEAGRRLATLQPGSEAHRIVEAKITRRKTQLRNGIASAKSEFREQEARIYAATYAILVDTVDRYARRVPQEHGLSPV